jgi:hypothetical protein
MQIHERFLDRFTGASGIRYLSHMEIRHEIQTADVADEVSAVVAVVRPILQATLYSLRKEVVAPFGGYPAMAIPASRSNTRSTTPCCAVILPSWSECMTRFLSAR